MFQDAFDFKAVLEIKHAERSSGIAISPETCIRDLPPSLTFCTAGVDFKLRLFRSDLKSSTCKVVVVKECISLFTEINLNRLDLIRTQ